MKRGIKFHQALLLGIVCGGFIAAAFVTSNRSTDRAGTIVFDNFCRGNALGYISLHVEYSRSLVIRLFMVVAYEVATLSRL